MEEDRTGGSLVMIDVQSMLPDMSQLRLAELLSRDDSVLQLAVQRVLGESDTHDIVAGFNSAI